MSRSNSFNLVLVFFFFLKNIKNLKKTPFELFEKVQKVCLKRASLNELSF